MEGQEEAVAAQDFGGRARPLSVLAGAPGGGGRPSSLAPLSPGSTLLPRSISCVPAPCLLTPCFTTPYHVQGRTPYVTTPCVQGPTPYVTTPPHVEGCTPYVTTPYVQGPTPCMTMTAPTATVTAPLERYASGPMDIAGTQNPTRFWAQGTPQGAQGCATAGGQGAQQGREGGGLGGGTWETHVLLSRSVGSFAEPGARGGAWAAPPGGSLERGSSLSCAAHRGEGAGAPGEDPELAELERKLQLLELKRRRSAERCEAFLAELQAHQEAGKVEAETRASRRGATARAPAAGSGGPDAAGTGTHGGVTGFPPGSHPSSTRQSRRRADKGSPFEPHAATGQGGGARQRSSSSREAHRMRRAVEGHGPAGGVGQPPAHVSLASPVPTLCPAPAAKAGLASGVSRPASWALFSSHSTLERMPAAPVSWEHKTWAPPASHQGCPLPGPTALGLVGSGMPSTEGLEGSGAMGMARRGVPPQARSGVVPTRRSRRAGPASCGSIPLVGHGQEAVWRQGYVSPGSPTLMATHLYYSTGEVNAQGYR